MTVAFATGADLDTIGRILDRLDALLTKHGRETPKRMTILMDLAACHISCPLRLEELERADDFNLLHDVLGIHRHMDRETGTLTDCFLPRYAARCRDTIPGDPPHMEAIAAERRAALA